MKITTDVERVIRFDGDSGDGRVYIQSDADTNTWVTLRDSLNGEELLIFPPYAAPAIAAAILACAKEIEAAQ